MTTKNQRALLVVCSLAAQGRRDLTWLYRGLEVGGVALADHVLRKLYGSSAELQGNDVTGGSVVQALGDLATSGTVAAVDVIWMTHGEPDGLIFDNGQAVTASDLADSIVQAGMPNVLRALYSTACFGATHNAQWLRAGFKVVAGARKVNANSATEFPVVIQHWGGGDSFADSISIGDNPGTRWFWDQAAKKMRFAGVDSRKLVAGDGSLSINS